MSLVNLLDSDVIALEKVYLEIQKHQGKSRDMESFRQEVVNRFGDAGFIVNVKTWTVGVNGVPQPGTYGFEVEVLDKIEKDPEGFDHERMRHEVQTDLLGLGQEPIKDPGDSEPLQRVVDAHKRGHSNGHGHTH